MAEAVVALTSAGATAIAKAIGGTKLQITSAHFGSDLINTYTQTQLEALTEVVSNGAASAVYKSDSSVITYLYPSAGEIQLRVNLGTSIGDFTIGNWGLVDSNGTLLFIIGLAATETKSKTSENQTGDNRVFILNIPLTSNLTGGIDFSILNVDAAALPEVTTEANLPSVDTSAYPVFHVQNYDSTNEPCLASRANEKWYYYLPLDSLLARDNTWTGTNTYTKTVTAESDLYVNGTLYTNSIKASSGVLTLTGGLTQTSEFAYVGNNQLLVRGWDGISGDHVVKTIGVGWGDSLIPFVEYYNTAGTSSGDTTLLQLATVNALDNLLTKNNTWTGSNTFSLPILANSDVDCRGVVTTNTINTYSGTLTVNSGIVTNWLQVKGATWTLGNSSAVYNGVVNRWSNSYVDNGGAATWDLNNGSPSNSTGNLNWFRLYTDGNLRTGKGAVAFDSDIANLQNQINGKQPAGNYVATNNANTRFYCWNTTAGSGDTIYFPVPFTDVNSIVINLTALDTSRGAWLTYDNVTNQSFRIHGRYMSHGNLDQMPQTQVSVMVYGW